MVVGQLQFFGRAQHALALDTAQFAHLDGPALAILAGWQLRTHGGARHFDTHAGIGCAADDVQQGARANIHFAHAQTVRVRVLHRLADFSDHHAAKRGRHRAQLFDL